MPLILSLDSTKRFDWIGKPVELLGESEQTCITSKHAKENGYNELLVLGNMN